jgi:predicted  nucleic acid-binding Zn-ribbon protein
MNQAQALYHLQVIDLDIYRQQLRLQEINKLLGENERIREAEQQCESAENALAPWAAKVRDLELEIKGLGTKTTAVEQRLYSGTVSNPKELQDMQEEVASLKRRRQQLEDSLLEAMIEVEAGESAVVEATQQLADVRSEWESSQQDLITERDDLRRSLDDLQQDRKAAVATIDAQNMTLYEKLYKSKRRQPVSPIVDKTCKLCGVGQTSAVIQKLRQGREIVYCPNCGRVLVKN